MTDPAELLHDLAPHVKTVTLDDEGYARAQHIVFNEMQALPAYLTLTSPGKPPKLVFGGVEFLRARRGEVFEMPPAGLAKQSAGTYPNGDFQVTYYERFEDSQIGEWLHIGDRRGQIIDVIDARHAEVRWEEPRDR